MLYTMIKEIVAEFGKKILFIYFITFYLILIYFIIRTQINARLCQDFSSFKTALEHLQKKSNPLIPQLVIRKLQRGKQKDCIVCSD